MTEQQTPDVTIGVSIRGLVLYLLQRQVQFEQKRAEEAFLLHKEAYYARRVHALEKVITSLKDLN